MIGFPYLHVYCSNPSKQVSFYLDFRTFVFFDPKLDDWVAEAGEYEILIGASSRDIRLYGTLILE